MIITRKNLKWVLRAVADGSRPSINQVRFDHEHQSIASTDGYRLHIFESESYPAYDFNLPLNLLKAACQGNEDPITIQDSLNEVNISVPVCGNQVFELKFDHSQMPEFPAVFALWKQERMEFDADDHLFSATPTEIRKGLKTDTVAITDDGVFNLNEPAKPIAFLKKKYLLEALPPGSAQPVEIWTKRHIYSPVCIISKKHQAMVVPLRLELPTS